ncbi:MAG: hypothetical protein EOP51_11385 [Sphingobacteriales bacterium]|nr:MAG: hypothetical protein EOP51_11385 [Sphingobacteriales bacterium]
MKCFFSHIVVAGLCTLCTFSFAQQWTVQPITLQPGERFDDIYMLSRDTGCIVSFNGTIYKTYDGGKLWYPKLKAGTTVYLRSIEFADDKKTGIAGALDGQVFRTTNAGENWTSITATMPDTGADRNLICGLAHNGNTFYGVGWWGSSTARMFKSTDGGKTWSVNYLDSTLATSLIDIACLDASTIITTGSRLKNGVRSDVILKSTDAGKNWHHVYIEDTLGGRVWKVQFLDKNIGFASIESHYFADTAVILKTTDGGDHWHKIPVGKTVNNYTIGTQGVGFINENKGWVGGYYDGVFETTDGGQTWAHTYPAEVLNTNRFFKIDSFTMFATYAGGAMKYVNGWSTSVKETITQKSTAKHKLYDAVPNPVGNSLKIGFDLAEASNILLEIVYIDGKHTYPVTRTRLDKGHYTYSWDASDKPAGNYIIWLGTDDVPMVKKFTKSQ